MRITNNYNLPLAIYQAIVGKERRNLKPDRFSVTDLINPPQVRKLKIKHWDGIKVKCDCCNGKGEIDKE